MYIPTHAKLVKTCATCGVTKGHLSYARDRAHCMVCEAKPGFNPIPQPSPKRRGQGGPMSNTKHVTVTNLTFMQRLITNLFTWSMLLLCIYVSQGSAWWTLVTGVLFILCIVGQAKKLSNDYQTVLKSKADAIAWANALPEDEMAR